MHSYEFRVEYRNLQATALSIEAFSVDDAWIEAVRMVTESTYRPSKETPIVSITLTSCDGKPI